MPDGRVVLVSDYAGAGGAATGGAGHVVLDSLAALRGYGVDARLIHGFGASSALGAVALGGADLREAGARGAMQAIYNPGSKHALRHALAGMDRASTVVILHQWTRYLSPSAVGVLGDVPTMVYLHDHFWACPNGAYYDFPAARPCDRQPLGPRCLAAQCDRKGRATKLGRVARHLSLSAVAGRGNPRRLLLHLSTRTERRISPLLPHERHALVRNPLAIGEAPPAALGEPRYDIGYFGRLEPEKGLAPLIAVLAAKGLSGLFVGEGAMADEIARHPRLTLRRWQPRETMAAAMRSCRMIVLPALWPETWGLIVPEAMAAGVPVLVSERAGSAELVERFGGGTIFDPSRSSDLAQSIETMLARRSAVPVADWTEFRNALSATHHAARIVDLAATRFGISLASRPPLPAMAPAPAQASRLPLPM